MTRLAAEAVSLRRGGAVILDGVSLALADTGSVAIIGPNGAGKSSLLGLLAGLEAPGSGVVRLDGRDIGSVPIPARARQIGYMPQYFTPHWDLSVRDLLEIRLEPHGGADLAPASVAARFGIDALLARRWSALSGGERARVLMAMVLAPDPPVLLADEPGASLDIRHRLALVQALAARGRDRLAVVVMHDLDLAFRYFQQIVLMRGGRIVAAGPAADLLDDPRLDQAFEVSFERIATADGVLLRARLG